MPFQIGEQRFDLLIGELDAFDASGRTDAFDGCDVAQGAQAFGGKRLQGFPAAFEFVYFGNQPQHLVRDGQAYLQTGRCCSVRHTRKYTRFYPVPRRLIGELGKQQTERWMAIFGKDRLRRRKAEIASDETSYWSAAR